jgi:hypothetical protein
MKVLFSLVIVLLIFSCSSISYKSDYDKNVDFSTYKKYKWFQGEQPEDDLSRNPMAKKQIFASVNTVLQQKGMIEVQDEEADFIVVIHGGSEDRMDIYSSGGLGWYGPWWGPYGDRTDVSYYEEGTLIIDIVDTEKKELTWRGMASGAGKDHKNAAEMKQYFDEVIERIFSDFPPR